jgi:glycosyltransferase involved in cell wall biosynthesis
MSVEGSTPMSLLKAAEIKGRRPRVALVQRFVPHYNLIFYRKLLASSRYEWEFLYGDHPGGGESGLASDAAAVLPTRPIRNVAIGKAVWQRGVARWLRQERYDAVVFEVGWQIISNALLTRIAHRVGTVTIPWAKGIAENGRPRPIWRQWLERAFTRQCDAMIVYGQVSADYFSAYGYPRDRIFIAQNTVDVRTIVAGIEGDRGGAAKLRSVLGLKDEIVIGYLGRLVSQKHVDRIIEAFVTARSAGLKARLVIAGDGPERAALEALAARSDAAAAIHFCGRVPEAEVGAYFQVFDIFVSAYSAGLGILEAMAHAKIPLITPEARPETELVKDGSTGIIAKSFSVADLSDSFIRAAEQARRGNELGRAAQQAVLEHATLEKMVEAFDEGVASALKQKALK